MSDVTSITTQYYTKWDNCNGNWSGGIGGHWGEFSQRFIEEQASHWREGNCTVLAVTTNLETNGTTYRTFSYSKTKSIKEVL